MRSLLSGQGSRRRPKSDLTLLLRDAPEHADEVLARRAGALLAMGRFEEARSDAASAYRRKPTPSRERLWVRTLLALGRIDELSWLDQPDNLEILPAGGRSLQADLRAALARLEPSNRERGQASASQPRIHRLRAVLLSALHNPSAEAEASRAIAVAPESAENYLVRARVRRRAGDRQRALGDVESALLLLPDDPRLLELGGLLKAEAGKPGAGPGRPRSCHHPRGSGDGLDSQGPDSHGPGPVWSSRQGLGTRRGVRPGGPSGTPMAARWPCSAWELVDQALVELEEAADWAGDRPELLARITLTYARCLGSRPARLRRWMALAGRTWSAWMRAARQLRAG